MNIFNTFCTERNIIIFDDVNTPMTCAEVMDGPVLGVALAFRATGAYALGCSHLSLITQMACFLAWQ